MNRRELITGLISLVAAPAIVRAGSLMPMKAVEPGMRFTSYGNYDILCAEQYHDLLKSRINAAYEILRRDIIANMERQIYNSTEPNPLLGAFD